MDTLLHDLRVALRSLRKSTGFTLAAILTIAVGIGANTAIFSVVNAVLLRAVPFPDADRLAFVWVNNEREGIEEDIGSYPNFEDWRAQNRVFEGMAAFQSGSVNLTGTSEPEQLRVTRVTEDFFRVLKTPAAHGRAPAVEEFEPGNDAVAVLSHGLWTRRFGADPAVVGTTVQIDGTPVRVIGVMPSEFRYPADADLWQPLVPQGGLRAARGALWLRVIARMKAGVTPEAAQTEMNTIAARLAQEYPNDNEGFGIKLESMRDAEVGDVRTPLLILLGAVGFVLLIGCANVANLLLARSATRRKEVAVRAALGAGRGRLVRQMLTESLVLALIGGTVGVLFALWGVGLLAAIAPAELPRADTIGVDRTVLYFALAVSIATGVVFGLLPALGASRTDLAQTLREGGRSVAGGAGRRLRPVLMAGEMALAVVLLIGASLMMRTFAQLQAIEPGFRTANVLTARVVLPQSKYPEPAAARAFYQRVIEEVEALPGVRDAAAAGNMLLSRLPNMGPVSIEGRSDLPPAIANTSAVSEVVSPGFFRTLDVKLRQGRFFEETDALESTPVAIVNEAFVRTFLEDRDPIGQRYTRGDPADSSTVWVTIVGVAGDMRRAGITEEIRPETYRPVSQTARLAMTLLVHTQRDPLALGNSVREAVRRVDADQPVAQIETLERGLAQSVAARRFLMVLLAIFAVSAVVLAAIGIYGVMSYLVSQRTREIGIRMALGAEPRALLGLILRQAMTHVVPGLLIGVAGALALTRLLQSQLYGVRPTDVLSFGLVIALLSAVALAASYVPARRATVVNPLVVLREE